jgi:hypothetical protein
MQKIIETIIEKIFRRTPVASGSRMQMAIFGKHQAWEDHMNPIGLKTEFMNKAKRWFYDEGILESLPPPPRNSLPYPYTFVWCFPHNLILGRMWPSSDKVGRKVPMIVWVLCTHVPLKRVDKTVLPELMQVEAQCRQAERKETVYEILDQAQLRLDNLCQNLEDHSDPRIAGSNALPELARRKEWDDNPLGLYRILYEFEIKLGRFIVPGKTLCGIKNLKESPDPVLFRIPLAFGDVRDKILQLHLWEEFIAAHYGIGTPALYCIPDEGAWMDVILRTPPGNQLTCLWASTQVIHLISDIPYPMSDEFLGRMQSLVHPTLPVGG